MLKLVQRGQDIPRHGKVYGSSGVVPVQSKPTVELAFPVGCDGVEGLKGSYKMFSMTAPDVFDPKVIYDKGESNGTGLVAPEAGRLVGWVIAEGGEMLGESLVSEDAGLW
jgi:hypothetical protein